MIVSLAPGESIRVELAGSDGGFEITFGHGALTVAADLPGNVLGVAGIIYEERWTSAPAADRLLRFANPDDKVEP